MYCAKNESLVIKYLNNNTLPLSHLELCWSVLTAFRLVKLRKMAASVPMKSIYIPENSSSSGGSETENTNKTQNLYLFWRKFSFRMLFLHENTEHFLIL